MLKWAGLIISILLAVTTLVTTFGYASLTLGSHLFEVSEGAIGFLGNVKTDPAFQLGWLPSFGIIGLPVFTRSPLYFGWNVRLPFWIPFLVVSIPTYILWRRDRRKPEGCCQECGYDLTGNVSGVCPECGSKTGGQP